MRRPLENAVDCRFGRYWCRIRQNVFGRRPCVRRIGKVNPTLNRALSLIHLHHPNLHLALSLVRKRARRYSTMVGPEPAFTSSAESATFRLVFVRVVLGLIRSACFLERSAGLALSFSFQSRRERWPVLASFASLQLSSFNSRSVSGRGASILASPARIHSTDFCRSISAWKSQSSPSPVPADNSAPGPLSPRAASVGSIVAFCSRAFMYVGLSSQGFEGGISW
jgi:hypothetical protein